MSTNALIRTIQESGPLTFAAFMELVLYHPLYGYYNSPKTLIGKEGDFFTSVHVSSLFGEMITEQLVEMADWLPDHPFQLVEYGAGKGFLAQDILETLSRKYPKIFARTTYNIIEISQNLRKTQEELLSPFDGQVKWVDHIKMVEQPLHGCVLSNELVDALPVHVVILEKGELKEIYVTVIEGIVKEITGPLSTPLLKTYFDYFQIEFQEGQRGEVCLAARDWIKEIGMALKQGFVLTVDYGYTGDLLYHPVRKEGTIMCYQKHKSITNPYINLGEQDITAHVNFTSLQEWGQEVGLNTLGLTNQMRFLFNLGVVEALSKNPEIAPAAQQLLSPEGMGGIFKVLIQEKGFASSQLRGLKEHIQS